jgi:hypothetical protein
MYFGYRVFPGVKSGRTVTLTPHPLLLPWSWKSRSIPLLHLWAVRPVQSLSACTRVHFCYVFTQTGPGSSISIAAGRSGDRIPVGARFSACPDWPWCPPSLLYNGYRVFSGDKVRPGRAAHPLLAPRSWKSRAIPLHPSGPATNGPITGLLYLFIYTNYWNIHKVYILPTRCVYVPHHFHNKQRLFL